MTTPGDVLTDSGIDQHEQQIIADYLNMLHHHGIYVIVSVCAICGRYLGNKDGQGVHGVSHGLCPECAEKMKGENHE